MTTEQASAASRLSDADMVRLMRLIGGADSVELKFSVPVGRQRATVAALPIDPVEAQPRQVYFFDTPDLDLDKTGVVVRARRIQGGRGDTVVKLRPVDPATLPAETRRSPAFNVEVDAMPGGFVCSASFKGRTTGQDVLDAVAGKTTPRRLFSKEQRAFYKDHAPAGIDLDGLAVLGPTFVLKSTFAAHIAPRPGATDRRMVAEMWLYPDGSHILEISLKSLPSEAFQVVAETRAYLAGHGVIIEGDQQTNTRTELEFFKAELQAGSSAPDAKEGRSD
jgi:hypothetical protein